MIWATSDPPPGSLTPMAAILSPAIAGSRNSFLTSSEPIASMIGVALSALYAPNGEFSTLAKLHFRDGSTKPVTPAMLMSRALIKSATDGAKRRS